MYWIIENIYTVFIILNVIVVPNKPNVSIVPVYSADGDTLIRINASVRQQVSKTYNMCVQ